ncbi:type IV toxin-antitoxin system AbiEi family antitoxin domain-containing protein [Cryptosporangium aurantiacum]|uniref:Transcriptional regulator, AbiEi antitoxin, Type IV TA system n=1 Tax=Cryptosporangium aurantiacum TaxID=134849 RepID=A0A1M7R1B4_9ACTN|nr:type IV toxin-antitoxin system AbiEi family antitoxin domain-containing protein [Cryptosporangium aurantiacum]SHN38474.1 Transcriptional regulator, AbiEi antitoxin, Type IV TA system [Cryptosporangium aurantiacum]
MGDLLRQLLAAQQGLILRRQALELGLTDEAIAWRIHRGLWRRVVRGLYATFPGPPSDRQRLVAANLLAGEGAQITGVAALRWHGLRYLPDDQRVHVLTPLSPRRLTRSIVVLIRTTRPDPHAIHRPQFDVCSVARAGADAARSGYSERDVHAFLCEMVQRRRTTVDRLDAEWRAGPVGGSKLLGTVLSALRDGVLSAPEAELRMLTGASLVLPEICWNPVLVGADGRTLPIPDGWIQDVGMALESDSDEFHTTVEDHRRTRDRHNLLATYGILTLHFSPREIRDRPRHVLATLENAYLQRPHGFTGAHAGAVDSSE